MILPHAPPNHHPYKGPDNLTEEGAEKLADRITTFWAKEGAIDVWCEIVPVPGERTRRASWAVKIHGLDRRGVPLKMADGRKQSGHA